MSVAQASLGFGRVNCRSSCLQTPDLLVLRQLPGLDFRRLRLLDPAPQRELGDPEVTGGLPDRRPGLQDSLDRFVLELPAIALCFHRGTPLPWSGAFSRPFGVSAIRGRVHLGRFLRRRTINAKTRFMKAA